MAVPLFLPWNSLTYMLVHIFHANPAFSLTRRNRLVREPLPAGFNEYQSYRQYSVEISDTASLGGFCQQG